jgi:Rad3-related DNA helicase
MMSKQPRSLILTSGTLKPLNRFEAELGIKFKTIHENKHVIQPS